MMAGRSIYRNTTRNNVAYEKLRQGKPLEVEHRPLARRDGIAGLLQHRIRCHEVSLADYRSPATYWPHAGIEQDA